MMIARGVCVMRMVHVTFHQEARDSRDDGRPPLLHVSFPASLKKLLVSDWERVTKEGEVLQLPHKHPVKTILEAHVEAHEQKAERETVGAVVDSLRQYFDQALPQVLLYQQEAAQSKRLLKHDKRASEVYGPEHLLRLLGAAPARPNRQRAVGRSRVRLSAVRGWRPEVSAACSSHLIRSACHPLLRGSACHAMSSRRPIGVAC